VCTARPQLLKGGANALHADKYQKGAQIGVATRAQFLRVTVHHKSWNQAAQRLLVASNHTYNPKGLNMHSAYPPPVLLLCQPHFAAQLPGP